MTPTPLGRLVGTDLGADLVLTRTYRAPIKDVWASLTEPHRTARWYGTWEGEAGPDRMIRVQMAFEEGQPWADMRIDACEPPHRLQISAVDDAGSWDLEVRLFESSGTTELVFTQHLAGANGVAMVPQVGPGWEYYLDMFSTAQSGSPQPDFNDYYPSMKPYYEELTAE
ncbi:SRPBCC family protein [Rhodococcus sp. ABRD24]|uniref:SRPBCC family protein n=1 Tax=Rhodococcus sp. ABRD24 TaxID=2507582 RepID=UPI001039E128|nr:SRPBCC family protein [Rhodococcus sp. ABRD24]QBJ94654.1 SRPBCC family protein [Rhodococcus sp. ABRD24]